MKRPVVSEPPDVIELVEAFDVVRHSVSLQHVLTLWDGGYGIDLQVWKHRTLRKVQDRVTRDSTADYNGQEFFSDLKEHGKSQIRSCRRRGHAQAGVYRISLSFFSLVKPKTTDFYLHPHGNNTLPRIY